MQKNLLRYASLHGFIAVAIGAFAAHGLKGRLDPEAMSWVETGARYQMFHALALLGLAALEPRLEAAKARWAGLAFFWGAVVFSGTLYAMALGAPRWLGAVTPIGGLGMLAGWGLLGWSFAPPPRLVPKAKH